MASEQDQTGERNGPSLPLRKQAAALMGIILGWGLGLIGGILLGNFLGIPYYETLGVSCFSVGGAALFALSHLQEASMPPQVQELPQEMSQSQQQPPPESHGGE